MPASHIANQIKVFQPIDQHTLSSESGGGQGWPLAFTVGVRRRRSPFTVHRSPFTVRRFGGVWWAKGPLPLTLILILGCNFFCDLEFALFDRDDQARFGGVSIGIERYFSGDALETCGFGQCISYRLGIGGSSSFDGVGKQTGSVIAESRKGVRQNSVFFLIFRDEAIDDR